MNQFYVSIIFIGIMLIVFSFVWIAYDSKKSKDYSKKLDEKKEELVEIISDAEQMIEEMNKFSDYIVTQMELKNEEMSTSLKCIEDRIKELNKSVIERSEASALHSEKVVNGPVLDIRLEPEVPHLDIKPPNITKKASEIKVSPSHSVVKSSRTRDKVIPLNNRYKEVIRLARSGMGDAEIARKLNMGKGEVHLVLEMNK